MDKILIVALGGSLGAVMRHVVTNWTVEKIGINFAYGTLIVNIIGCFIIGFVLSLIEGKMVNNQNIRLLLIVGFTGGLTTFSTFSYETIKYLQEYQIILAVLNIFLNMFLGISATLLGIFIAKLC